MPSALPAILQQYTGIRAAPAAPKPFGNIAMSASELDLANLHLDYFSSKIQESDLLDTLPALPKSIVEEEEEIERGRFVSALAYAATDSPIRIKSPEGLSSYFNSTRRLFYDADSAYTSSSSGSSFSTPSLESDSDVFLASTSTSPLPTPAGEYPQSFPSSSLDSSPTLEPTASPVLPVRTGIAARRRAYLPKLEIPPFRLESWTDALPQEPSSNTAEASRRSTLSPPRVERSTSAVVRPTLVSTSSATSSSSWSSQWRQDVANIAGIECPGSPKMLRLKKRRSNGFAF